ncbi:hypothetical protein GWI33_009504 [Rhynchophorus ferrugineus]|uniref:Uncharacterized protein n=1 Tax=Rhynchophorus ferrugineus TaxID=354439 RepID=A0A834IFN3_RHYFE|nr:hypothetical protein GWI33_009504 [Rhynchophorus ferrugineus]
MMRLFYLLFFVFVCQAMHTNQIQPIKGTQKDTVVKRARDNYDPTRAKINATEGTTNEDITISDTTTTEERPTETTTTEERPTETTTTEATTTDATTTPEPNTFESTATEGTSTDAETSETPTPETTTTEGSTTETRATYTTPTDITITDTTTLEPTITSEGSTTELTTFESTTTEATTTERTTTDRTTTERTTTERTIDYLVRIRSSNVPSADYQYDAVGILQVLLDETRSMATALPQFLKEFQSKHDSHIWKLSHACTILLLPSGVVYMELYEHATGTTIYLFE